MRDTWFSTSSATLTRQDLRPEIGGFGTQALSLHGEGEGPWTTNVQVPPGLKPGRHAVRLRTADSKFSTGVLHLCRLSSAGDLEIRSLCDGVSWRRDVCETATGRFVSFYTGGIADNSDKNNLEIVVGGSSLKPIFIGPKR